MCPEAALSSGPLPCLETFWMAPSITASKHIQTSRVSFRVCYPYIDKALTALGIVEGRSAFDLIFKEKDYLFLFYVCECLPACVGIYSIYAYLMSLQARRCWIPWN